MGKTRNREVMQAIAYEVTNQDPIHPMWESYNRDPIENIPKEGLFKGHKHWKHFRPNKKQIKAYLMEVKSKPFGVR